MAQKMTPADTAKLTAARRAAAMVHSGMIVGLGTGSTAAWLVRCLGERVAEDGLSIVAVATSNRTAALAREVGIEVVELGNVDAIDLTIDGADEIDDDLVLIKGGGGALLREKIVAAASGRMVVIAGRTKYVSQLGAFPLPVEIVPFGWQSTRTLVREVVEAHDPMGDEITLRMGEDDDPYVTDGGNLILDLHLKRIGDVRGLTADLNAIPGVVDNGLFVDMCDTAVIADAAGRVTLIDAVEGARDEREPRPSAENLFADL